MALTGKQAHVLANLDRVGLTPYKVKVASRRKRFALDGQDCTLQVTALIVRKEIQHMPSGALVRRSA